MNIDPNVAQRQADFIDELEEKLAELKSQPVLETAPESAFSEQEPIAQTILRIPKSLHRKFKTLCAIRDESMASVINSLIAAYVEEHGPK